MGRFEGAESDKVREDLFGPPSIVMGEDFYVGGRVRKVKFGGGRPMVREDRAGILPGDRVVC